MKKTVILCLMIVVFVSMAIASDWTVEHYVDEFGDTTESVFLTSGIESGSVSSFVSIENLNWQIRIDEANIIFVFFENGVECFKGSILDNDFLVKVRDNNGIDYSFYAYRLGKYITVDGLNKNNLLRILAINDSPRIIIETESSYGTTNTYKLGLIKTEGLAGLYEDIFGLDWSQPISIELSTEKLKIVKGYKNTPVIGVNIYLGTERFDCPYKVDFDSGLTQIVGNDFGFEETDSNYNAETNSIDNSHLYLHNSLGISEERSGYLTITTQIGDVSKKCFVSVVDKLVDPETSEKKEKSVVLENFEVLDAYNDGMILVTAILTKNNAELTFNIDDSSIRKILEWLVANSKLDNVADVSYNIVGSKLYLTYPTKTENSVEDMWLSIKAVLIRYNKEIADILDSEANKNFENESRIISNVEESSVEVTPSMIFSLRSRLEAKGSIDFAKKAIECAYNDEIKKGISDKHGLFGLILESRFFINNKVFISASIGPCAYLYSFIERDNTNFNETKKEFATYIGGASAEIGFGVQHKSFYASINCGVIKTFQPKYNENLSLTLTGVLGVFSG